MGRRRFGADRFVLLIATMLVALFKVHITVGFRLMDITGMSESGPQFGLPGYEVNVLYVAGLAALASIGQSELSLDRCVLMESPAVACWSRGFGVESVRLDLEQIYCVR